MLDANVDPLGDDPVSDLFVDDDSNGTRVDVEDGSSAAVVVLVRHTLVDGSIDNDVDDVSDLVGMWMAPCCLKPFLNLCLVLRL